MNQCIKQNQISNKEVHCKVGRAINVWRAIVKVQYGCNIGEKITIDKCIKNYMPANKPF